MTTNNSNAILSVVLSLGTVMIAVLFEVVMVFMFWLFRDDDVNFWIVFINKAFYSFQLVPLVSFSAIIFHKIIIKELNINLTLTARAVSYLVFVVLIILLFIGGIFDSNNAFGLYNNET